MKTDALNELIKASEYKPPWIYDPSNPPLLDTVMRHIVDSTADAVGTGAKRLWKATEGSRNRFGNWFKSTLDKPENIQPGQPRFLGR